MKILVVGHKGMLGTDMMVAARRSGHEVIGIDYPEIDITSLDSIRAQLSASMPDTIINCAAFTAVDLCESETAKAFAVNAVGAGNLAAAAAEIQSRLVHYSTDYVFDGAARIPYVETDKTGPMSAYGRSKLEGEKLVASNNERSFIIRIAWLYGTTGNHFVKTIRALAAKRSAAGDHLRVVDDQIGSPTCTLDVCRQTLRLLETDGFGLYHATSEGQCSWHEFAQEIVRSAGIAVAVDPCSTAEFTAEFPRPAPRPAWSVLENAALKRLGLNCMPHWSDAFSAFTKLEAQPPR
jgi:dTDP-4-dehydrorhamnose reductase